MRSNSKEVIELEGEIIRETDRAIYLSFTDDNDIERKEWFPLSQVSEIHRSDPSIIVVSSWIYEQKISSWEGK